MSRFKCAIMEGVNVRKNVASQCVKLCDIYVWGMRVKWEGGCNRTQEQSLFSSQEFAGITK